MAISYPADGTDTLGEYIQLSGTVTDVVDTPTYLVMSINGVDTRTINNNIWDTGLGLAAGTDRNRVG